MNNIIKLQVCNIVIHNFKRLYGSIPYVVQYILAAIFVHKSLYLSRPFPIIALPHHW